MKKLNERGAIIKMEYKIMLYNNDDILAEIMVASTKDKANRVALYWCNRTYKRTKIVRTEVVRISKH